MGYEIAVAARGTPLWGFATVSSGSKFPAIPGLAGAMNELPDADPDAVMKRVRGLV